MPRWVLLVLATVSLAVAASPVQAKGYGEGRVLFQLQDKDINESSGLVSATSRDGLFFTHNDSGDRARFFALDGRGCTLRTFNLKGLDPDVFANESDVEDIARGPYGGRSSLWLADIGDNNHMRPEISVHRVDEPSVAAGAAAGACATGATEDVAATTFRLAYPDTPHDAETLLADPLDGRLYIVTKTPLGQSSLYAAPAKLDAANLNTLELVGTFVFPISTTYDRDPATELANLVDPAKAPYTQPGFDLVGRLSAVGGDIAPDRSRVVVRTYTDAHEWTIPDGAVLGAVLMGSPIAIPLLYQRQGEAIAYTRDGRSLLTTCEDVRCPAHLYLG